MLYVVPLLHFPPVFAPLFSPLGPSPSLPDDPCTVLSCLLYPHKFAVSAPSFRLSRSGPPINSHQNCCKASNFPPPTYPTTASPSCSQFHKFFQLTNLQRLLTAPWRNPTWHQRPSFGRRLSPFLTSLLPDPRNQCPHPQQVPTWSLCSVILSLCLPVPEVQIPPTLSSAALTRRPHSHPHPA